MKFFHLSDLHIGKQLHHYNMVDEQRDILDQIVELTKREQPDAVLIAGDIYDTPVPSAESVALFDHFLTELNEIEPQVTVCMIAGNHDSAKRLDFASSILAKHRVVIAGMPPVTEEEYLEQVVFQDAYGEVAVYLLPFVKPSYVRGFGAEIGTYEDAVHFLIEREQIDPEKRNVIVSHQFYTSEGVAPELSDSEIHLVGGLEQVDIAVLDAFDYAALGHIHRAQRVGIDAVRYAGAPLCYHLDECGMQKSVTLVRVGKRGVEKIEQLPLSPRRAMRHLTGPLAKLTAHPTDTEDYIWATLTDPTPLPDAMAQLRAAYPNAMRLDYLPQGEVAHPLDMTQAVRGKPFVELFQDFFTKMNGRPLTVEETVAVKRLREEASKSE